MARRKSRQQLEEAPLFAANAQAPGPAPPFLDLISAPLVSSPLPKNFKPAEEAEHMAGLWQKSAHLRKYEFKAFVHAGGSGMVFVAQRTDSNVPWALKVVRKSLYDFSGDPGERAVTLSPVSQSELRALEILSHPNVVRLFDTLADPKGVFGIATTYVEKPQPIDEYIRVVLASSPKGMHPLSLERLDRACQFIHARCSEIANALCHMHEQSIYHFDIKPNNILVSGSKTRQGPAAMLTDMGSCIHARTLDRQKTLRVHFTWTYAHPNLTTIVNDPGSLSGGGLKASASIDPSGGLARFDLFAFGKTIQELLAVLEEEFRERCNSCHGFRYLHSVACLLLDGHNSPGKQESRWSSIVKQHGKRFANDVALEYPPSIFENHRIATADELVDRLERFSRKYSWNHVAPELDIWQADVINSVAHSPAPFTRRVSAVFNHPCFRRLKQERQLGWMREVFPGATHDRWTHSLGTFSAVVAYIQSLLSDPDVPTFRILVDEGDIAHAFLAAILHDLGQTAFGHDLEEACPYLYSHDAIVERLLDETHWGEPSLRQTIEKHWSGVDLTRVLHILAFGTVEPQPATRGKDNRSARPALTRAIDGVFSDAINGPIDADKLDYLVRDSIACGVPYGHGIDVARFVRALTVTARQLSDQRVRLALAYKAKGRAAILSILLARYQMWGAVYWHHTYRCIQAMFTQALAMTFGAPWLGARQFRASRLSTQDVRNLFYWRVIVGKSLDECATLVESARTALKDKRQPSTQVQEERVLDLVWRLGTSATRELIDLLASRTLYKRIFEMRLGELGGHADYSALKGTLTPAARAELSKEIAKHLVVSVENAMRERGPKQSVSEDTARQRLSHIKQSNLPLTLLDFPVRGISDEKNTPVELGDAVRKYSVFPRGSSVQDDDVFDVVRKLQQKMATVRVFASPEFHELTTRYLAPTEIRMCVEAALPQLRTKE